MDKFDNSIESKMQASDANILYLEGCERKCPSGGKVWMERESTNVNEVQNLNLKIKVG